VEGGGRCNNTCEEDDRWGKMNENKSHNNIVNNELIKNERT
jgi:hypothetical protein